MTKSCSSFSKPYCLLTPLFRKWRTTNSLFHESNVGHHRVSCCKFLVQFDCLVKEFKCFGRRAPAIGSCHSTQKEVVAVKTICWFAFRARGLGPFNRGSNCRHNARSDIVLKVKDVP